MLKTEEISILIVEDHALTRFGLKTAFDTLNFIKEIIEAEDGESGVQLAKEIEPDIVLMDLGLPGINGIEATRQIKSFNTDTKVIILTSHNNENEIWAALGAGANAYCLKDIEPERLMQVVESVSDGAAWLDPAIAGVVLQGLSSSTPIQKNKEAIFEVNGEKVQLTERETEVLRLIVDGFSNADIAEKLYVSIHTAKAHVCNILQKLSVDDRTQAAIKALKGGIV